jgi:hypothetical protein
MATVTARPFAELFGGRPGDGDIASLARAAARAGYSVLAIKPGTKQPLCMLTANQAKAADKHVAQAAKEAGKRNWERVRHPCGKDHATTDPAIAHRVFKRLAQFHPDLNVAVEVYRSRVLVVDADTIEQLRSFTSLWAAEEHEPALVNAAPTVRSPGEMGPDGAWKHSDGGHFWFLLDDDTDLGDIGNTVSIPIGMDANNQAQLKISGYVLVPPSTRPEGEYRMASDAHSAPAWLVERVQLYVTERRITRVHRADRCLDAGDTIALAQAATSWSAMLEPRGWSLSYKVDRCGCEIWTAPGEHASPKSGTFHDSGCGQYDTADGFGHVWTDNPPEGLAASGLKTFSKIQFVAWSDHGGDMGTAMRELGITRERSEPTVLPKTDRERLEEIKSLEPAPEPGNGPENDDDPQDVENVPDQSDDPDPVDALLAELIPASELDNIPPPVPLVDGILDRNSLVRVIGTSGHGKSFFMIDIAGHVSLGTAWQGRDCTQGNAVYMVAEGVGGIRARVRSWEAHHGVKLEHRVMFLPRAVQVMNQTEWMVWVAAMARIRPALIVIDTQARITVGANENEAKDMGVLVARAELLRAETGACVVLVHHKGRQGDHGRGSTVVPAALDAEISVTKQGKRRITVLSEKQKDREDFSPISLDLVTVGESAVLIAAGTDQPFEETGVNENSSIRDRVAKWIHVTFSKGFGATKPEVWNVVHERDRGPNGKPMAKSKFYEAWAKLEAEGVLIVEDTEAGKRWMLDLVEAVRLGLDTTGNGSSDSEW